MRAKGLLRRNSEYPLYDGYGSERTVTNGSETVTGTINCEVHTDPYRTFGQTAGSTGSSSSPYMYAGAWGYRTDGDAGLMHVGARYYDAQVGRFITRDTVLSEHPYLYCEHDAVNWVDPSGKDARPIAYEPGVGPGGEKGWWKVYPGGERVFEGDPAPNRPPKGHTKGTNVKPRGGEEHSRIHKGPPKSRPASRIAETAATAGAIILVGWGIWQIAKWGTAVVTAPPTGGVSLIAAAALP